jgi:hypothetical protein
MIIFTQGNSRQGLNELLKLVRVHPLNARLWTIISQIIFTYSSSSIPSSVCRKATLTALKLSSMKSRMAIISGAAAASRASSSSAMKSSAMISLSHLMEDEWKLAKLEALKGIRKYPEERENWTVLACAFWFQFVEERTLSAYTETVRLLQKEMLEFQDGPRISERAQSWAGEFLKKVQQFSHIVAPRMK